MKYTYKKRLNVYPPFNLEILIQETPKYMNKMLVNVITVFSPFIS